MTLTGITFNETKKGAIDEPIIELHVSEDSQWSVNWRGVQDKKEGLESSCLCLHWLINIEKSVFVLFNCENVSKLHILKF